MYIIPFQHFRFAQGNDLVVLQDKAGNVEVADRGTLNGRDVTILELPGHSELSKETRQTLAAQEILLNSLTPLYSKGIVRQVKLSIFDAGWMPVGKSLDDRIISLVINEADVVCIAGFRRYNSIALELYLSDRDAPVQRFSLRFNEFKVSLPSYQWHLNEPHELHEAFRKEICNHPDFTKRRMNRTAFDNAAYAVIHRNNVKAKL